MSTWHHDKVESAWSWRDLAVAVVYAVAVVGLLGWAVGQ